MKLTFSIIIPSYQQGEFLAQNLESLLLQDASRIEVIIQDGGSHDASLDIIKKYSHHPWKNYQWVSKPDKGQTNAINQGISKASGNIIAYLNSDDYLLPGALDKASDFFGKSPDTLMLYGKGVHVDEEGKYIGLYPTEPWTARRLLETCFICQPACFWRRELHQKIGTFDESLHYGMDYDFWLRTSQITTPAYLEETLAASRCHTAAKRFACEVAMREESLAIVLKYNGGKAPYPWITSVARARASKQFQTSLPLSINSLFFCIRYLWTLALNIPLIDKKYGDIPMSKMIPPLSSAKKQIRDPFAYLK